MVVEGEHAVGTIIMVLISVVILTFISYTERPFFYLIVAIVLASLGLLLLTITDKKEVTT